ncbi:iron-siderophore ABC transporter permease [Burkholderia mayonis]|uniref:Iron-siderophore ABC transporter permease n=2 Tax=Burkholderiaceae TaxID=119060 RepID=A0A1B4FPV2_9BURK|nr:iron-siderophore ABC transporter permease [Burkholderia mayonis]KVE40442.1 iron-siderophore ABC transporter permease [Burkholderia sp. BDU5]KVE42778.1 iron-siderophore ABC transporter permease [Burkholderia mayonis]
MWQLYAGSVQRRLRWLAMLGLLALLCSFADLSVGPAHYPMNKVFSSLWNPRASQVVRVVLHDIRIPAALTALVVGASLSVAGVEMQTVLNNPLASPFTLGVSAAASFGAALGLVLGVSVLPAALVPYIIPVNAFVMAMGAVLLIDRVTRWRGMSSELIVLLGTTLVFAFTALLQGLQYMAPDQALAAVVFWSMGSLTRTNGIQLAIMAGALLLVLVAFMRNAWALTALRLGDARAGALGVPVAKLRLRTIVLSSLLASVCVSFVGAIGFVGLIGPHIARMLVGEDQRFLLPAAALCGATLLSAASVASKVVLAGQTLPIGIVTSLVGVPLFFVLIVRKGMR